MCGRFALVTPTTALRQFVEFVNLPNIEPRYNITPGQPVSLIRRQRQVQLDTVPRLDPVQWGLVPGWARADYMSRPGARPQINARAETVQTKPSFKNAFRRRRALLPANGFYEWERKSGQPYLIRQASAQPFFMAAIWDIWAGPDGSEVEGCAVVTVEAAENLAHIHHRMPAMIAPANAPNWLSTPETDAPALQSLLQPADEGAFTSTPVSRRVNKRDAEGADLWQETEPEQAPEQLDFF